MTKFITTIALIALIAGTGYYYRATWKEYFFPTKPCEQPITYSITQLDERFGLSEDEILTVTKEAEDVWEAAFGKDLFAHSATGTLGINLIYDYRQEATDKLSSIGSSITNDRQQYDMLKSRLQSLRRTYDTSKATYEKAATLYEAAIIRHNEEVAEWNSKGGAPEDEYNRLERERKSLNRQEQSLKEDVDELYSIQNSITTTINDINKLAHKLNVKVEDFNTVGASTGEEFNEGEYIRDKQGERINVYQFQTRAQLRRLLAHELGHALGMNHVDDSAAIMYRLNSSTNEMLTDADIQELMRVCSTQN